MGVGIYLKSSINKKGTTPVFIKATDGKNVFKRNIGILVKPSEWDNRQKRIKGSARHSVIINRRLGAIESNYKDAWSEYEAGYFGWDRLCVKLGGSGKNSTDSLLGFLEDVIKPKYTVDATYKSYKWCVQALLKALGKSDIQLRELTNQLIGECVIKWKSRNLAPTSIETYITHIGGIKNEAYKKGLISEKLEKDSSWTKGKKKAGSIKIIQTCKSEEFENAISKIKNIRDVQAMMFYLLMFSLRGLYIKDLVTMHRYETNVNEPDDEQGNIHLNSKKRRYIKHQRSKNGVLMEIRMDTEPIYTILYTLRDTIKITHGDRINKRTGKPFKKGSDVYSPNELEGWLFKYDINDTKTHNDTWNNYQKRIKKLIGMPFKTARKTFESYALKLRISEDLRYKLLGHTNQTIKAHYQDWEWDELKKQVDEAHQEVLKEYRVEYLFDLINKRAGELGL